MKLKKVFDQIFKIYNIFLKFLGFFIVCLLISYLMEIIFHFALEKLFAYVFIAIVPFAVVIGFIEGILAIILFILAYILNRKEKQSSDNTDNSDTTPGNIMTLEGEKNN